MSHLLLCTLTALNLTMGTQDPTPKFLLIVRERLRPGAEEAYAKNELEIAAACAALQCPHPYLALGSVAGPKEVWWLNAFASGEEKDELAPAYARNAPLMARLGPLGKRKEGFRESLITTLTKYRADLSARAAWRVGGARFFVVGNVTEAERQANGVVFESSDGQLFAFAPATSRAAADSMASRASPDAMILAVEPQWSFPAESWIAADPDFWRSNAAARNRPRSPRSQ